MRIIIPSNNPSNLTECLKALGASEPDFDFSQVIVVHGSKIVPADFHPSITWLAGIEPFIYARAVNQAISQSFRKKEFGNYKPPSHVSLIGYDDVVVMGDDVLITSGSLNSINQIGIERGFGIISATVDGVVANPAQRISWRPQQELYITRELDYLAFVCVWINGQLIDQIGLLDERFNGYGFEDSDFCKRAQSAYWVFAVTNYCVVNHKRLPSSYRSQPGWTKLLKHNQQLYEEKWRA